ncbi:membrane-spanning 4-domains subfamily A member 4A-like [Centropristis striata]|uniref:membrane-spanning 4-domains subfamily A member 4A-like n=1 Tax=Centropristis striata TaxID=184440 RepID=UPI0027DEF22B|nr:membrane-spanning 4-domains subfamily A member 4A-like [Centropristis striata]XP_059195953.1 membrane-spanning 4-domains subfamily A member 4A-like [Centropristis striata]
MSTSTSITTVGGVVVVTQVIPQEEAGIQLQSPAPTTQAPPPAPPSPAPKVDDMTATFLRGEPRGLGVVQIFVGLLLVLFSLTAVLSPTLLLHAPLAAAAAFVVSGSVAVAAARRTTVRLVWASLLWNLLGVLLALGGVAYVCWLLAAPPPSLRFCGDRNSSVAVVTEEQEEKCRRRMRMLDVCVYGALGLLLVLLVLQVCVNVTVCVFSGRSLRHHNTYTPLKVEDRRALLSGHDSDVSLLDSP